MSSLAERVERKGLRGITVASGAILSKILARIDESPEEFGKLALEAGQVHDPLATEMALAPYLDAQERVLWSGQLRHGLRLQAIDALFLPFSLMWTGFAISPDLTVKSLRTWALLVGSSTVESSLIL